MTFPAFLIPIIIAAIIILYIVIHYERKTMERADRNLKKEHELLRITLSSIRDGVIAANEKGEIIFMNYPAEVLTGISEKESVNKQLGEVLNIVNPENGGKYEFPIENVLKNNHTVYFEGINVLDRGKRLSTPHSRFCISHCRGIRENRGNADSFSGYFRQKNC